MASARATRWTVWSQECSGLVCKCPAHPGWLSLPFFSCLLRCTPAAFSLPTWATHGPLPLCFSKHLPTHRLGAPLLGLDPLSPLSSTQVSLWVEPGPWLWAMGLYAGAAPPTPAPRQREAPVWEQVSWSAWLLVLTFPILELRLTIWLLPSPGFWVGPGQGSGERWNWGHGAA